MDTSLKEKGTRRQVSICAIDTRRIVIGDHLVDEFITADERHCVNSISLKFSGEDGTKLEG